MPALDHDFDPSLRSTPPPGRSIRPGEMIAKTGLFRAFYTDLGSHYFHTPKAGGKVDKTKLTQVGRALQQLGVTHISS